MRDDCDNIKVAMAGLVIIFVASIVGAVFMGCGSSSPSEDVGESEQALHATTLTLQPTGIFVDRQANWIYSPAGQFADAGLILGDWTSGDPNASYVCAPAGTGVEDDYAFFTVPPIFTCNSLVSVQSIEMQYRLHTGSATEQVFGVWFPNGGAQGEADVACTGAMQPWRPVGSVHTCGRSINPVTGAAWSKNDFGCNGGSAMLAGFKIGSHQGVCIESMQLVVHGMSL